MSYAVDFVNVSTVGLESSPVATSLAGLRANEARYFKNKYDHVFTVEPAAKAKNAIDWVHRILKEERDIAIASPPLEDLGVDRVPFRHPRVKLRRVAEAVLLVGAGPGHVPVQRHGDIGDDSPHCGLLSATISSADRVPTGDSSRRSKRVGCA